MKVVTAYLNPEGESDLNFNPPHREGGDDLYTRITVQYCYFNPHHREGGDMSPGVLRCRWKYFNPHHREGGDCNGKNCLRNILISIHTTAKVVTSPGNLLIVDVLISIHTTAKVVTDRGTVV